MRRNGWLAALKRSDRGVLFRATQRGVTPVSGLIRVLPLILAILAAASLPASATTYYKYDILGRVIEVTESDGTTIQYSYDADGNIVSIVRTGSVTALSIGSISTNSGASGSSVTINGSGFSDIASQDNVTFNGVSATVTYASGNRLVVMVPNGATTGDVAVSTPGGSATSSGEFTVVPGAITGFTPAQGTAGTVVTVTGSGFDATASNDAVSVNGLAAMVSSASTDQLQFTVPAGATAGHIAVTTPQGSAVSAADFFIPESGYSLSQVAGVGALVPGGSGRVFTTDTASQVDVALFDGAQGQMMTLMLTNVSMGGQYTVHAPDRSTVASGSISDNDLIALPALPATGTYSFYLVPGSAVGSADVYLQTDSTGAVQTNGTAAPVSLVTGQGASYTFSGTAGTSYSLELTQYSSPAGFAALTATIVGSDGTVEANCGSYNTNGSGNCDFTLSASGTYTVNLVPNGLYASSFNILLNQDFTAALAAGTPGPAVNVSLVPGQHGLLTFSASAGQTLALYLGSVAVSPSNANVGFEVLGPSGASIASSFASNGGSATINLRNLAGGTYSVLITPNNANSGAASMQVELADGVTATVPTDGTTATFSAYLPGQNVYLTFAGTAGQNLGLGITQLALDPATATSAAINVDRPNGQNLTGAVCYTSSTPGCQISLQNLPTSGNYTAVASPSGQSKLSFAFTASPDVTGTLTLDQASSISLGSPGENGLFTLTASGGQPVILYVGSLSVSPTGSAVLFYVYDSSGTLVNQGSVTAAGQSINLGELGAGTYTVLIAPNDAATATLQVSFEPGASGALPVNGTSVNFSTTAAGQATYLTFSGTSGETLSLALTSLVTSPSSVTSVNVQIKNPDGTSFTSTNCYTSWSGCEIRLKSLPQTGTYTVTVTPSGQVTMNFTATLSQDVTGTLTAGSPLSVDLAAMGQSATLTFSLSSAQTVALNMGSLSVSPSGATMYATVYDSSGSQVATAGTSTGTTLNLTNLAAGTYTVQIVPSSSTPVTGTVQVTLERGVGGTLATTSSGSGSSYSTLTPGQNAYFTFSGTAGENVSLAITGLTLSPTSVNSASVQVDGPSGQYITSGSCYSSWSGCEYRLRNLPATGTYTVTVSTGQATMSFTATLSQDVTGTLTAGSPLSVALAAMGQSATLTFSLSSAQTVALNMGSLSVSPSGATMYATVYDSSGSQVATAGTSTGTTLNLTNLAAGTYTVQIVPSSSTPVTGTVQATLEPGVGGTLAPTSSGSGSSYSTLTPGQNAYFTFSGTAGENISLAITGLTFSPTSVSSASVQVDGPSGQYITSGSCYSSWSGCEYHLGNLPATGTYTVTMSTGQATMSFTATLSQDVTGMLTSGSPLSVALAAMGESATVTFTTTTTQTVTLTVSSVAVSPSEPLQIYVYNASGTDIQNAAATTQTSMSLSSLPAGTYTVFVTPNEPVTGSFQVTVQ